MVTRLFETVALSVRTLFPDLSLYGTGERKRASRRPLDSSVLGPVVLSRRQRPVAKRFAEIPSRRRLIWPEFRNWSKNHAAFFVGGSNFGQVGEGQYKRL